MTCTCYDRPGGMKVVSLLCPEHGLDGLQRKNTALEAELDATRKREAHSAVLAARKIHQLQERVKRLESGTVK